MLNTGISEEGIVWRDVFEEPFAIHGLYQPHNLRCFRRLPENVAKATSEDVYALSRHTSGGRLRFRTDSDYVAINTSLSGGNVMPHMPLTGSHGFDLYVGNEFFKAFIPPFDKLTSYDSIIRFNEKRTRDITLHFPLYSGVDSLHIGLPDTATLEKASPYLPGKPVVYYGSSITQGGCAGRPGNAYPAHICRNLNRDYICLGFSGSARGEAAIVDYMSDMEMCIFVCDYDHNAPNVAHLQETYPYIYKRFRERQPDLPIIFISKPDINLSNYEDLKRRDVIYQAYSRAIADGDENIFFIDGYGLFESTTRADCTVDGCHPNDLGFYRMAEVIGGVIKYVLNRKESSS